MTFWTKLASFALIATLLGPATGLAHSNNSDPDRYHNGVQPVTNYERNLGFIKASVTAQDGHDHVRPPDRYRYDNNIRAVLGSFSVPESRPDTVILDFRIYDKTTGQRTTTTRPVLVFYTFTKISGPNKRWPERRGYAIIPAGQDTGNVTITFRTQQVDGLGFKFRIDGSRTFGVEDVIERDWFLVYSTDGMATPEPDPPGRLATMRWCGFSNGQEVNEGESVDINLCLDRALDRPIQLDYSVILTNEDRVSINNGPVIKIEATGGKVDIPAGVTRHKLFTYTPALDTEIEQSNRQVFIFEEKSTSNADHYAQYTNDADEADRLGLVLLHSHLFSITTINVPFNTAITAEYVSDTANSGHFKFTIPDVLKTASCDGIPELETRVSITISENDPRFRLPDGLSPVELTPCTPTINSGAITLDMADFPSGDYSIEYQFAIDLGAFEGSVTFDPIPAQTITYDLGESTALPSLVMKGNIATPVREWDKYHDVVMEIVGEVTETATVEYSVAGLPGGLQPGVNFEATSGTLTISPGDVRKTVRIPILQDGVQTLPGLVTFRLSNPSGITIAQATQTFVIVDGIAYAIAIEPPGILPEGSIIPFEVLISMAGRREGWVPDHTESITMDYEFIAPTFGVSAEPHEDFDATVGSITIPPGTRVVTVNVPTYRDFKIETFETITMRLFNLRGPSGTYFGGYAADVQIEEIIIDATHDKQIRMLGRRVGDAEWSNEITVTEGETFDVQFERAKAVDNPYGVQFYFGTSNNTMRAPRIDTANRPGLRELRAGLYNVRLNPGHKRRTIRLRAHDDDSIDNSGVLTITEHNTQSSTSVVRGHGDRVTVNFGGQKAQLKVNVIDNDNNPAGPYRLQVSKITAPYQACPVTGRECRDDELIPHHSGPHTNRELYIEFDLGAEPNLADIQRIIDSNFCGLVRVTGGSIDEVVNEKSHIHRHWKASFIPESGNREMTVQIGNLSDPDCPNNDVTFNATRDPLVGSQSITFKKPPVLTISDVTVRESEGNTCQVQSGRYLTKIKRDAGGNPVYRIITNAEDTGGATGGTLLTEQLNENTWCREKLGGEYHGCKNIKDVNVLPTMVLNANGHVVDFDVRFFVHYQQAEGYRQSDGSYTKAENPGASATRYHQSVRVPSKIVLNGKLYREYYMNTGRGGRNVPVYEGTWRVGDGREYYDLNGNRITVPADATFTPVYVSPRVRDENQVTWVDSGVFQLPSAPVPDFPHSDEGLANRCVAAPNTKIVEATLSLDRDPQESFVIHYEIVGGESDDLQTYGGVGISEPAHQGSVQFQAGTADSYDSEGQLIPGKGATPVRKVQFVIEQDAIDEGNETITLDWFFLNNQVPGTEPNYQGVRDQHEGPGVYYPGDTSTITLQNQDPLPKEWLANFAHSVGKTIVDAIKQRTEVLHRKRGGNKQSLEAWATVSRDSFHDGPLGGATVNGLVGFDRGLEDVDLGILLSIAEGTGNYGSADLGGHLYGIYPYLQYHLNARHAVWATLGASSGHLTVDTGKTRYRPDASMYMGAVGSNSRVLQTEDLTLTVQTDAMLVRARSQPYRDMRAADTESYRTQLALAGSYRLPFETVNVELHGRIGFFKEGGDIADALGVENELGTSFRSDDLSFNARIARSFSRNRDTNRRTTIAGSLVYDVGHDQTGLVATIAPEMTVEAERPEDRGFGRSHTNMMVGYGIRHQSFLVTPNVGFGLSDAGARDYRIGWRLTSAVRGDPGFEVTLDATRREPANDNVAAPVEHGVMLRGAIRW